MNTEIIRKNHTYREVFTEFFNELTESYIRKNKAPKTLMEIMNINTTYILDKELPYDTFADDAIEQLSAIEVKKLKLRILESKEHLSHKRLKTLMYYIDKVFIYAFDHGYVSKDFLDNIRIKKIGGKQQKSKAAVRNFLSTQEFGIFNDVFDKAAYKYFRGNEEIRVSKLHTAERTVEPIASFRCLLYRSFFSFIFYTGARKNEARSIRWCDLISPHHDIDIYSVKIDEQFTDKCLKYVHKEEAYTRNPKSDSGIRICFLHENCVAALLQLKLFLIINDLFDENNFIFHDFYCRTPKPIPETNIDRCFQYMMDKSAIEKNSIKLNNTERHVTIHGMRHSACSMLLEMGMDKYDVARFLGHTDMDMVNYIYNHFISPEHAQDISNLTKYFKNSDPTVTTFPILKPNYIEGRL